MTKKLSYVKQKGAYSVELALTLFVLFGFVLIFWEYISIFVVHQRVTYAAYMSERSRVVGGNPNSVGLQLEGGQIFVGTDRVLVREQLQLPVNLVRVWGGNNMLFNVQREVSLPVEPDDYGDNQWMPTKPTGNVIPYSEFGPVNY